MSQNIPSTMRAAVNRVYGGPEVVNIETIPVPTLKDNQVLIRVHASTVSTADWRLRSLSAPRGFKFIMRLLLGYSKPRYTSLGTDTAGEIVAVGKGVKKFKVGDRVVSHQGIKLGGHAEYCALPETCAMTLLPEGVDFATAAASCFGGMTALCFLREKAKMQAGQRVLVIGAAGAVGSAAVQMSKMLGLHVTAVVSSSKVETAKALGADAVIDYTKEQWMNRPAQYEAIFDSIGVVSYEMAQPRLTKDGKLLAIVADLPTNLRSAWINATKSQKVLAGSIPESSQMLGEVLQMVAKGSFKPLIGMTLPLSEIVKAHQTVDSGHKIGSVVITIANSLGRLQT
jgi:NADPH:quinone reductase-like Zn-dependent oxidoreductase